MKPEQIERYLAQYSASSKAPKAPQRLPLKGLQEKAVICILIAYINDYVRSRSLEFRLDDNTISNATRLAKWMFHSHKRGLVIRGGYGNGKTSILRAFHMLFHDQSFFTTAQNLFDFFRSHYGFSDLWDEPILIIDDLGAEPERGMLYGEELHPLAKLLTHRYEKNLTTLIATNLTVDEICTRYGERLYDRILEMYSIINVTSSSYRGQRQE